MRSLLIPPKRNPPPIPISFTPLSIPISKSNNINNTKTSHSISTNSTKTTTSSNNVNIQIRTQVERQLQRSTQFYSNLLQPTLSQPTPTPSITHYQQHEAHRESQQQHSLATTCANILQPKSSTTHCPQTETATKPTTTTTTTTTTTKPPIGNKPIQVIIRVRPKIQEDHTLDYQQCVYVDSEETTTTHNHRIQTKPLIRLKRNYYDDRCFRSFQNILPSTSTQQETYDTTSKKSIQAVMNGINSTILCYGQTGSGKTYTMFGTKTNPGLVPRSIQQLFQEIKDKNATNENKNKINGKEEENEKWTISISLLEIYLDKMKDLLIQDDDGTTTATTASKESYESYTSKLQRARRGNTKNNTTQQPPPHRLPLKIRRSVNQNKQPIIQIENLKKQRIRTSKEAMNVLTNALKFRQTNSTNQNKSSSRSHTMLTFTIEKWTSNSDTCNTTTSSSSSVTRSTLTMVDLAGSERVAKSGSDGVRLNEAKKINRSIAALGNCIAARSCLKQRHVPFRDHVVTRILESTLSGNTFVTLVVNVGPSTSHYDETFSTLLLAKRALRIKNSIKKNSKKKEKKTLDILNDEKKEKEKKFILRVNLENEHFLELATQTPLRVLKKKKKVTQKKKRNVRNEMNRFVLGSMNENVMVQKKNAKRSSGTKSRNCLYASPATKKESKQIFVASVASVASVEIKQPSRNETLVTIIKTLQEKLKAQQNLIEALEVRQRTLFS